MDLLWQAPLVATLGAAIGASELISRYRDEPLTIFKYAPTLYYVALNAALSLAALALIDVLEVVQARADGSAPASKNDVYEVLIAGLGAAAFFRSSFAKTKVAGIEVGVGPAFLIDTFLGMADREIDRRRARSRLEEIPGIMGGVRPAFAAEALVEYCIHAMQNLSGDEKEQIDQRCKAVLGKERPGNTQSLLIGLILSEYIGIENLKSAKTKLLEINDETLFASPEDGDQTIPEFSNILATISAGAAPPAGAAAGAETTGS